MQGYAVRVQPVELPSGDTWHRVMIGPFSNIIERRRGRERRIPVASLEFHFPIPIFLSYCKTHARHTGIKEHST